MGKKYIIKMIVEDHPPYRMDDTKRVAEEIEWAVGDALNIMYYKEEEAPTVESCTITEVGEKKIHNPKTGTDYEVREHSSKYDPDYKPKSLWEKKEEVNQ